MHPDSSATRVHALLAELAGVLEAGALVPGGEQLAAGLRAVLAGEAVLEDVLAPAPCHRQRERRDELLREYADRWASGETVAERARETLAAVTRYQAGRGRLALPETRLGERERLLQALVAAGPLPTSVRQLRRILTE